MTHDGASGRLLDQPRAVWAVAFAAVIAFMGIGLVDPILPAIGAELHADKAQVELLFTSYMAVTGAAMLVTGYVSSRLGAKRTLLLGLALVVVFAGLAGASSTIGQIVGFRAGWGLGNALFIATALATIVGAASGGVASAIILYEAALGIGIATGPLLGGLLGGISWRAPFFGTAALMAIGFIAIATLLPATPAPQRRSSVLDPLRALRHRGLLTMGLTALFYNFGFFTLLAFTPFPLGMGAHELGLVFFGWGLALAITSVFVAPHVQARVGTLGGIRIILTLFALVLAAMAVLTSSPPALVVLVVVSGALLGVNNTLVTEAVMKVSPVERPVASAGYSFLRFIGGAIAPWLAGTLSDRYNDHVPYVVGTVGVLIALLVLYLGRASLAGLDRAEQPAPEETAAAAGLVLLAVDSSPAAAEVTLTAGRAAAERSVPVLVLHVREVDVTPEDAVEAEPVEAAQQSLAERIAQLGALGVSASGILRTSVGDHADVARTILQEVRRTSPSAVVIGAGRRGAVARLMSGDVPALVRAGAGCRVYVVDASTDRLSQV
jgi:MFS family permease